MVIAAVAALLGTLIWLALIISFWRQSRSPRMRIRRQFRAMILKAEKERAEEAIARKGHKEDTSDTRNLEEKSLFDRVVQPVLRWGADKLQHLAPAELRLWLEHKLQLANLQDKWSVRRFVAMGVFSWVLALLLTGVFIQDMDNLKTPQKIVLLLLGGCVGTALPFLMLNHMIQKRQEYIRLHMPEVLDLLCVSVQAGLSFDAAVSKITKRMQGPLIDEFRRMQRDTAVGMTRQRALAQMALRCGLEEMDLFTSSVIQAEQLGANMSRTLKMQADNMRDRHRQHIKSLAMKTPVKISFPMLLFIFPAMLMIILYPTISVLLKNIAK